ncbi:uncharacterized protein TNCV_3710571 [Trichonephila clavipes]|nr:uncharacterized protein TNCV_3710571 [Trichonephila clavipes]
MDGQIAFPFLKHRINQGEIFSFLSTSSVGQLEQILLRTPQSYDLKEDSYQKMNHYFAFIQEGNRLSCWTKPNNCVRICDRWVQEGTTDRRGRSHPPQCTTSREDRQIVRRTVTDHLVKSQTIAQHIESVTHRSVSVRTIRHRSQQSGLSARRPQLGIGRKTDASAVNGAMKEGCGPQNGIKWSLLTSHASVCNTTMIGFESGDTVERGC